MFNNAIVLGALGQVGCLLAQSLANSSIQVTGIDKLPEPQPGFPGHYLHGDALAPSTSSQIAQALRQTDALFVCLPEDVAIVASRSLLHHLRDQTLWVDTLSIKGPISEILQPHDQRLQILSINPMFAPALGWRGRPVAAILLAPGARATAFEHLLQTWGASLEILTTAAEHDQITAALQVATHAAALAFGAALSPLGYDVHKAVRLATPPHRLLLSLLRRIVTQNPEVYWEIQKDHPLGNATRGHLLNAVQNLDATVTNGDKAAFYALFHSIAGTLKEADEQIAEWTEPFISRPFERS